MTPSQIVRVGHQSATCRSRRLLVGATESWEREEYIGCAVKLRESARQLANALIDYYAAWGAKMKNDRTSSRMVKCLESKALISGNESAILYEALVLGNRFAHCICPENAVGRLGCALDDMSELVERFDDIIGRCGMDNFPDDDQCNDLADCLPESEVKHGR